MATPFVRLFRDKQKRDGSPSDETPNKKVARKSPEHISDDESLSSLLVYVSLTLCVPNLYNSDSLSVVLYTANTLFLTQKNKESVGQE